ncbi:MAG: YdcF family protein [Ferruginibacter sp.]
MHQFISSVLSFFLSPVYWIILLIIAGFLFRRPALKKYCRILALFIFLLFSNRWVLNWYANKFQPAPLVLSAGSVYSCGIVPGGFASPDVDGNGVFNPSADRFIQALKLFKQGHITHILVTGGNGKKEMKAFNEAAWVKNELIIMGVPDSVIFIEDKSRNTAENAVNTKKILDTIHLQPPYLLISSALHLPRASLLFKKAGVPVIPFPCNYIAGRGISTIADIIPGIDALFTWELFLKETIGYWWYRQR